LVLNPQLPTSTINPVKKSIAPIIKRYIKCLSYGLGSSKTAIVCPAPL
jgi:hypothetical protein